MTAGSPCLDRHVPRSEERARIERAVALAREGKRAIMDRNRAAKPDYIGASLDGYETLCKIIGALDGGDPRSGRDETQAHPAKPPQIGGDTQKETV